MIHPARALGLAAAAAAVLVASAPTGGAQDALPPGWTASVATVDGTHLSGAMQRDGTYWDWQSLRNREFQVGVAITVGRPEGLPAGCTVPTVDTPGTAAKRREFAHDLALDCNGTYPVTITGSANAGGGSATIARSVVVARPAPAVTGVEAELDDDVVALRWDDMTAQAKDLTAYQVSRRVDQGSPSVIAELTPSADGALPTALDDADLPARGEVITYEVVAVRRGTGPGPSTAASRAAITREGEAVDPPDESGDGPGSGDGDSPGDGVEPGGGDGDAPGDGGEGSGGGDGGGSSPDRPRRRVTVPRVGFSRSFLPPLLSPRVSPDQVGRSSTSTTVDGGYDEDLPYNPVDGPLEPELPDDELAGFFTGEVPGRGMAIPVATALVLAGWAMHLRVLARASRPHA